MSGAHRLREALRQTTRPLQRLRRDDQSIASTSGASSAMFSHIRNRLIMWYIGILAAILLLLGLVLYFAMQNTLFAQVNTDLATNAQVLGRAWQINFAHEDPKPICLDQGALDSIAEQLDVPYLHLLLRHQFHHRDIGMLQRAPRRLRAPSPLDRPFTTLSLSTQHWLALHSPVAAARQPIA